MAATRSGSGSKRHFASIFSPGSSISNDDNDGSCENNNKILKREEPESQIINGAYIHTPPRPFRAARGAFKTRPLSALSGGHDRTNDEVHQSICIVPALKALMATEAAQRLRGLSQLGCSQHAYINATHNRFEHSLGVSHLARLLCERLQKAQPLLNITERDVLCVVIAGFCHDLGHGPFSHVFDGEFQESLQNIPNVEFQGWKHEQISLKMLEYMLGELGLRIDPNNLDKPLQQIGDGIRADCFGVYLSGVPLPDNHILTSRDLIFVQECILGRPLDGYDEFIGRDWDKQFLYDIVNNTHSGLDVDKMDYYARDHHRTLGPNPVKVLFLEEAIVARSHCCENPKCFRCSAGKQVLMICYPTKLVVTAMDFFRTRFKLHTEVYTHKTVKAVEYMVCDILKMANPYITFPTGENGHRVCIHQAVEHPHAFVQLTDSVLQLIRHSDNPKLKPAEELIQRLQSRKLYKCVCTDRLNRTIDHNIWDLNENEILEQLLQQRDHLLQSMNSTIQELDENGAALLSPPRKSFHKSDLVHFDEDDVVVEVRKIHHGMKDENPVKFMRFLSKEETFNLNHSPDQLPIAEPVDEATYECHIPRAFMEKSIRVYNRSLDEKKGKSIDLCVQEWLCRARNSEARFETLSQLQ